MPETTEQYHRIPLSSGHEGHRIRTITISAEQGIKALYCGTCKEIVTYLFETGKWTMAKAKQWVKEHKSERRLEMDAIRGERSLDRITELVKRAWWEQIERPINERGDPRESTPYVINVFTDRVIIGLGADYYEVAYELADDGAVTFAQRDAWKKAELEWTALERAVARLGRVAEAFGDLMANLTGQGDGLRLAKVGDYQIATVHTDFGLAPGDTAWEWDAAAQNAIVDKGGWAMYKAAHLVTDTTDGDMPEKKSAYTYPVAQLIGGDMQYVFRAAATVYGGLKGGARAASLPQGVKEAALKTVIGIYKRFGRDTSEMSLSADQVIERFTAALAQRPYLLRTEETGAAPITNEQGWVKKVILRTGEWKEPAPGQTQPLAISLEHLLTIKAGFDEGAYERVSVPIGHGKLFDDMQHATENNAGFVRALEVGVDRVHRLGGPQESRRGQHLELLGDGRAECDQAGRWAGVPVGAEAPGADELPLGQRPGRIRGGVGGRTGNGVHIGRYANGYSGNRQSHTGIGEGGPDGGAGHRPGGEAAGHHPTGAGTGAEGG